MNAAAEFFLLIFAFLVAGLVRLITPIGATFFIRDIILYFPTAIIYSAVIVALYLAFGAYRSLDYGRAHGPKGFGNILDEIIRSCIIHLLGLTVVATILYSFHLLQFSRILLVLYFICTVFMINLKRYVVWKLSVIYRRNHQITRSVVLVGSGKNASRYYDDVLSKDAFVRFCGYVSEQKSAYIDRWLGSDLQDALIKTKADMVVYAEDVQNIDDLSQIASIADVFRVPVRVVSVYSGMKVSDYKENKDTGFTTMTVHGRFHEGKNTKTGTRLDSEADVQSVLNHINDHRGKVFRLKDGALIKKTLCENSKLKHYFLCADPASAHLMMEWLMSHCEELNIVGVSYPLFCSDELETNKQVCEWIRKSNADIVWVGIEAEKQNEWLSLYQNKIDAVLVGTGIAFPPKKEQPEGAEPNAKQSLLKQVLYGMKRYLGANIHYIWKQLEFRGA